MAMAPRAKLQGQLCLFPWPSAIVRTRRQAQRGWRSWICPHHVECGLQATHAQTLEGLPGNPEVSGGHTMLDLHRFFSLSCFTGVGRLYATCGAAHTIGCIGQCTWHPGGENDGVGVKYTEVLFHWCKLQRHRLIEPRPSLLQVHPWKRRLPRHCCRRSLPTQKRGRS